MQTLRGACRVLGEGVQGVCVCGGGGAGFMAGLRV